MGDEEEHKELVDDVRLVFMLDYLQKTLQVRPERWQRMLEIEDFQKAVLDFLTGQSKEQVLVITTTAGGVLVPVLGFPASIRNKAVYFIKRDKGPLHSEDLRRQLMFGDLAPKVLDEMSVIVDELFVPLLSNPESHRGWPQVVADDVVHHAHTLKNTVREVRGKMRGHTILPMPLGTDRVEAVEKDVLDGKGVDMNVKSAIESMTIKWAGQVNDLLKESSHLPVDGQEYFPTPTDEMNFWSNRERDLEFVYHQLCADKVRRMASILQLSQSAYFPCFKTLFSNVVAGLTEVRHIAIYLKPLKKFFEKMEVSELEEIRQMLRPLLVMVCMVWSKSEYYRTQHRVAGMLTKIANLLINQASKFLDPSRIMQGDVHESRDQVDICIELFQEFSDLFTEYKEKLPMFFENEEPVLWTFDADEVFARKKVFVQRLEDIRFLFLTAEEFLRLERVVFGGIKGHALSNQVEAVLDDFKKMFSVFVNISYDVLLPEEMQFDKDYKTFYSMLEDLDHKLASIFIQALDDCHNLESFFKCTYVLGQLMERPIIYNEVAIKYNTMIEMLMDELETCKELFDERQAMMDRQEYLPVDNYMPPVAGMLMWINKLRYRITKPVDSFQQVEDKIMETPEAQQVLDRYNALMDRLAGMEDAVFSQWAATVGSVVRTNLDKPLLIRVDEEVLAPNFQPEVGSPAALDECRVYVSVALNVLDGSNASCGTTLDYLRSDCARVLQLTAVLREVSYMKMLEKSDIPEEALDLHDRAETLRQWSLLLDYIISSYNSIHANTREEEFALIEEEVEEVNEVVDNVLVELTWDSEAVAAIITHFFILPPARTQAHQYAEIQAEAELIHRLLEENRRLFMDIPLDAEETPDAAEDEQVAEEGEEKEDEGPEGRAEAAAKEGDEDLFLDDEDADDADAQQEELEAEVSEEEELEMSPEVMCMMFFMDEMDVFTFPHALFEVFLHLKDKRLVFEPSLDPVAPDGLKLLLRSLLDDVLLMPTFVPRIFTEPYQTYESYSFLKTFDKYTFLWMVNRQAFIERFAKYGCHMADTEFEVTKDLKETPPSNERFKEQIDYCLALHSEVEKMSEEKLVQRWLRLNLGPMKRSLLDEVLEWAQLFKDYLVKHVVDSLNKLEQFCLDAEREMLTPLEEGDYEGLLKVMGYLRDIRDMQVATDQMFQPLHAIIELLRPYDVDFPEEVFVQLQELPDKWANTKRVAATVRQTVAPLMATEITLIRKKLTLLDLMHSQFRETFRKQPFFRFDCTDIYKRLDKAEEEILELEAKIKDITDQASLFEISTTDFKLLDVCKKEIKLLKQIWDFVKIVQYSIDEWKKTPWKSINVEAIEMACKDFTRDIRGLDRDVRQWDVYTSLDDTIKNLLASLKAVTDLQDPAMRTRHWQQLMNATKVMFVMDDKTTLADLLALHLHEYEDIVTEILERSRSELKMETVLKELDTYWGGASFEHDLHPRTGMHLLRVNEQTLNDLDDNLNALQTFMSSRDISFFLEQMSNWLKKLNTVDQVIQLWMEVQRTWAHLEAIFIGSEDIRKQLPEDTARFEHIDRDFRGLLMEAQRTPNIVTATNRPNLSEKLESLQRELQLCEQALAEYLETKRLAFPRFYFVSSADLLDILANGNQPQLVARHLTKLYDSMAKLKFKQDGGKSTKTAVGVWAKDGEYVDFSEDCLCDGKVEVWLNRLTETMRRMVRHYFGLAVNTYDEKPREQWIFDYPAQPSLVGTQIWWTTEVTMAFARLEEGYEMALRDYNKKQVQQLSILITLLVGDLTSQQRQKITTICTIDVHSRDVVGKLINEKVDNRSAFLWQSQLRHRWDEKLKDCFCNICDAQFRYAHEYLGNTPRLVITPLTDRCYITLTQSLHLIMGGAPAGPAGTGKTETTKDLGKAMGIMVYVFNCSEQMDYKSCGNIYKGLAQTGAWGCFDEFNRISVEVLSVVAVQVKSVLDGIKSRRRRFMFMGNVISLNRSVGMFITMNPGYAGRTELPENLKALFRPCAMVVPDLALICENMLLAEGFQDAKLLGRKFITLYMLCKELLSKQDHYDWGLRAIKSVLVVAGSLKRGDRLRPEDQVLMRALRDFNVPKIVTEDRPVFMGLIGDLFPGIDVPPKRDYDFEKVVKQAVEDIKLQAEDNFILKIVQLEELLQVRHSVFIVGNAGTGKSMVWHSLFRTYQFLNMAPFYNDLNPKAVTNDELFGIINPATREWKDGLLSTLMRDQANLSGDGPKWIVLDGDIDPMWIESLNTVMDDNKVLTLASNERIALTRGMRLLFEIASLRTATPATVSRAGILYINPQDLGWNPYVFSWLGERKEAVERASLLILFDKYIPPILDVMRTPRFKRITPIAEISHVQMLCHLLMCLLVPENITVDSPKEWYEMYFVFACVWAFGAAMFQDQLVDHRVEFSKWWVNEFKTIKFPQQGTVFSYYIDNSENERKFVLWTERVKTFHLDYDIPMQSTIVPTPETTRLRYFMDLLMAKQLPVMLVGLAGTGKSVLVADKLSSLPEAYAVANVPFNYYTTSTMLQKVLEHPLEKKAGRAFGPPGGKNLIYFVDDMNMPEVDEYGTVQPHTLLRQFFDYKHWYDRTKLSLKDIHNCQFVSCMNPTAGSFTINPRLQRHFCVFATSIPGQESMQGIYQSVLQQHLSAPHNKFSPPVAKLAESVVAVALKVHARVTQLFLPTAIKFHYVFNLRDLSNIFQGMLFADAACVPNPSDLIRLWMHEATRVYGDKLIDTTDIETFEKVVAEIVKKGFEELNEEEVFMQPLIFYHYTESMDQSKYMPISDMKRLEGLLVEALALYNDSVAAMNLVLFEDAIEHVCRITRILESPRGNALLIGVGGSGKQSLSRLAAFICTLDVFQIQLRKGYSTVDLKVDLAQLYLKAGIKGQGNVFLMTDAQVAEERFLVLINDLLSTGEIPDMFAEEEVDNIVTALRTEVKMAGFVDNKENCWKFFIDRVRRQLKVVLCFSPVGPTLRIRSRQFPAVVSCSAIDWFHEWPQNALESVSARFLGEIEVLPKDIVTSVSLFMSYVHTSVNKMSQVYLLMEKRYNYTTPKSFLEQIGLFGNLLTKRANDLNYKIERLQQGLERLRSTSEQVDDLKLTLADQEVVIAQKQEAADILIKEVETETKKVTDEKSVAAEEEEKVKVIEEDVSAQQKVCAADLELAMPALNNALAALDTLDKENLSELKSFPTLVGPVMKVVEAVIVLMAPGGKVPRDRSWKEGKRLMGKVDSFLQSLRDYDKNNIHPNVYKAVQEYIKDPLFNPDAVSKASKAAAGLCAWVRNIISYYDTWVIIEPKQIALKQATETLNAARAKLLVLGERIRSLEEQLDTLTKRYEAAAAEKEKSQQQADATARSIDLANRLVNGLASENVRWSQNILDYQNSFITLPGDILFATAFLSYVGCFTKQFREDLVNKHWLPFMKNLTQPIEMTENLDVLNLLADDAIIAQWNNDGLPTDRMSSENAIILISSTRWPLIIDPQLQGIKWIKNMYGSDLKVVRPGQKRYLDVIESAVSDGDVVLLENIGEAIDAVLDPLLGRTLIKKGTAVKMGEKEVHFNPKFRLILQTKLANPHYKPEMQAQTTLINFTVTRDGLEDQLLAEVVKVERPDLESKKSELTKQQNDFKITLKELEDNLLQRLAAAGENILGDVQLVENLETTKKTAADIEVKVAEAKIMGVEIDAARERYRVAATRASLLYFILNDLHKINPIYQFSLKAFGTVFQKALVTADENEDLKQRVINLLDSITFSVFMYTSRGLFESDKLIFMAQMAFQILLINKEIEYADLDFLLRFPVTPNVTSPVDFIPNVGWGGVKSLSLTDDLKNLDRDIEGAARRWQKVVDSETPEKEKLPGEWRNKTSLQKLCIMRALRPDRMTYAITEFINEKLGNKYTSARTVEFAKSYEEMSPATPVFFILSPGVDPLKDVEALGKKLGFTMDQHNFHNVSLGQGQEVVAEQAMETAATEGHWVILQNIHLVKRWLPELEKKMEHCSEIGHDNYRLFISAESSPDPAFHIIPQGILESSIKITNEPPTGMQANLHKALDNFTQETLEMSSKEAEFKAILFALCYFHAVIAERRKFGPQGWNRNYPFNMGDLTICVNVLYNYLESSTRVPWEDLRYLFGEIMYGGHITDDWDRRLCRTYLEVYLIPALLDGDLPLAPGFQAPPNLDYKGYHNYISDNLPSESPVLYGLHPNAEIGFLTTTSERLFRTVFEMQPRDAGATGAVTVTREEKVKQVLDEILEKLPDPFNMPEIMARAEEKTPFVIVAFQECERLNFLTTEMRRSLRELELGLKGELTITADMEQLQDSLFLNSVPDSWSARAYPSLLSLGPWIINLILRIKEFETWTSDFVMPGAVWLSGFFNPQSFITAVMQVTARKNEWPLDRMCIICEVVRKQRDEITSAPRDGAYVHGLFIEGARWDEKGGTLTDSLLKDLYPAMPLVFVRATTQEREDKRNMYGCPLYKTRMRGPTYVWTLNLRTRDPASKWILAGVALLLQI
ncbi:dynein beta chain, ciliary-like [Bacillus rossius redtenbacheri]|uniref:dynein beta chain, ciliary-like n=1 Tax=Bacillus rossius redtenbacheri TaxID=93214 RepID=UPI002FDECF38